MCADPISTALTVFSTMSSYYGQQAAAKAQAQSYKNQAVVDEQNAKIAAKQAESTADSYAQQQEEIRNRMRIAKGTQAATAGSMGVDGASGSMLDLLGGSYEAYNKDVNNLLSNQRNDVWSSQMQEHNLKQSAASNRDAAANTMSAAKIAGLSTILGGAASINGLNKTTQQSTPWGDTPFYTPTWGAKSTEKSNPFGLDYNFNKKYGFYKSKY